MTDEFKRREYTNADRRAAISEHAAWCRNQMIGERAELVAPFKASIPIYHANLAELNAVEARELTRFAD